jgi:hypothetical protein
MIYRLSPYLKHESRLAEVIAAIQVMGTYEHDRLDIEQWKEKIGSPKSAESWQFVFNDHPEFFRVNDIGQASLRWRHADDRDYHLLNQRKLYGEEITNLSEDQRKELVRKKLSPEQIKALMVTAVEFHSRAIAQQEERRWWIPLIAGFIGSVFGGGIGAMITVLLKIAP